MSGSSIIGTWEVDGNFVDCNPRVGADVIKEIFLEFVDKMGFEASYFRACKAKNDREPDYGLHGRLPENRIEFLNYHVRNRNRSKNFIDRFSWCESPGTGCKFSWVDLNTLWTDLYYKNNLDRIVSADEVYKPDWDYDHRLVWEGGLLPYIPEPVEYTVFSAATGSTLSQSIQNDSIRYSTAYGSAPARIATEPDFDYGALFDSLPLSGEGENSTEEG